MPRWAALSIASFLAGLAFYFVMPYLLTGLGLTTMKYSVLTGSATDILGLCFFMLIWGHVFGWPVIWAAEKLMPNSRWRYILIGTVGACLSGIIFFLIVGLSFDRQSLSAWVTMVGFCFFSGLVTTGIFTALVLPRP